jgi:hypothetical protein
MNYQTERNPNEFAASFEPTRAMFDLARESKELFDALVQRTPEVRNAFDTLRESIPLPATAVPGIDGRLYRLPNHNRSFCYSLVDPRVGANSPVLVVKGAEPLLRDFPLMIDWMLQAPLRKSTRVMADHFPLAEGKIPGALSLKEALSEARIALDVQKRHLTCYGELARIPVPLFVYPFSDEDKDTCSATLRSKLSQSAFDRIGPLLREGLAIYVYYYPSPPVRANYLGELRTPQFKQFVEPTSDEGSTVLQWARLLIRLLYLGYLPYSVRNEGLGACIDFGNAALDGGFCDPDSIIPVDAKVDDEFFCESVVQTLRIFQNTVERLLVISHPRSLYPSAESFACWQYISRVLHDAVVSESRPGLALDPRFLKLMHPESTADIKSCAYRTNRIALYQYFAQRHATSEHSTRE